VAGADPATAFADLAGSAACGLLLCFMPCGWRAAPWKT